jgi:two-component system nitrate/nitrite response regulator NarL
LVLKETASRQLIQVLRQVAAGETSLDQKIVQRAVDKLLRRRAGLSDAGKVLTNREVEIVRLVATGLRNKQIADQLNITEGTVKIHLHSIFEKLGVSSRVELSNYAREKSLL